MATEIRRSRNSYARSSRSVTVRPTGMPSRSLNAATDLRARRMFGCWPAMSRELLPCAASSILESCLASPTPMLSVTLTSFGACIGVE